VPDRGRLIGSELTWVRNKGRAARGRTQCRHSLAWKGGKQRATVKSRSKKAGAMNGFAAPSVMRQQDERGERPLKPPRLKALNTKHRVSLERRYPDRESVVVFSCSLVAIARAARYSVAHQSDGPRGILTRDRRHTRKMGRELASNSMQRYDRRDKSH
jgi:hypothetical protein